MRLRSCISIGSLALGFLPSIHAQQQPQTPSLSADQKQVVAVLGSVFAAAEADDAAKFDSLIASGFYMFDNGKRFDGDAIMGLIKSAHAAGMKYEWNVTEPDAHITGKTAWIAYINRGNVTDAKGTTQNIVWLESADLEKQHGVWKLVFMESERIPAEPHQ